MRHEDAGSNIKITAGPQPRPPQSRLLHDRARRDWHTELARPSPGLFPGHFRRGLAPHHRANRSRLPSHPFTVEVSMLAHCKAAGFFSQHACACRYRCLRAQMMGSLVTEVRLPPPRRLGERQAPTDPPSAFAVPPPLGGRERGKCPPTPLLLCSGSPRVAKTAGGTRALTCTHARARTHAHARTHTREHACNAHTPTHACRCRHPAHMPHRIATRNRKSVAPKI